MPNPRVPDNILEMRGTFRKDRHGDPAEKPQLPEKAPSPPKWLPDEAKKEWRRICRLLKGKGVLAELDRPLLTQYCTLWQQLYDSQTWRERYMAGELEVDVDNPPHFSASSHAQMRMVGSEIGIGAVSRSKIRTPQAPGAAGKPRSPWDDV